MSLRQKQGDYGVLGLVLGTGWGSQICADLVLASLQGGGSGTSVCWMRPGPAYSKLSLPLKSGSKEERYCWSGAGSGPGLTICFIRRRNPFYVQTLVALLSHFPKDTSKTEDFVALVGRCQGWNFYVSD